MRLLNDTAKPDFPFSSIVEALVACHVVALVGAASWGNWSRMWRKSETQMWMLTSTM